MLPIRDNVRARATPWVVITIAVLCGIVFYKEMRLQGSAPHHRWQDAASDPLDRLLARAALIPEKVAQGIVEPGELATHPGEVARRSFLPLLTSLFLHAGLGHVLSNLWFLWVFGKSVEGRLGTLRFAALYFGAGILAGLVHIGFMAYSQSLEDYAAQLSRRGLAVPLEGFVDRLAVLANEPALHYGVPAFPDSRIPTIGASGAISGVLGAYLLLFPRARVLTFIPPLLFWTFEIPAILFIGFWIATQTFGLWDALSARLFEDMGGIAYGAHFGGFVAGLLLALLFRPRKRDETVSLEIR